MFNFTSDQKVHSIVTNWLIWQPDWRVFGLFSNRTSRTSECQPHAQTWNRFDSAFWCVRSSFGAAEKSKILLKVVKSWCILRLWWEEAMRSCPTESNLLVGQWVTAVICLWQQLIIRLPVSLVERQCLCWAPTSRFHLFSYVSWMLPYGTLAPWPYVLSCGQRLTLNKALTHFTFLM